MNVRRRHFLGSMALAGIGTTAGCMSSDNDEYATMQQLMLLNDRDDPVTMELRIERDDNDEVVHEETYEIDSGLDGTPVDCVWPDEPLRVLAQHDKDDEWSSLSTAEEAECLSVLVEANNQGTTFFLSREECPIRSPHCHTSKEE